MKNKKKEVKELFFELREKITSLDNKIIEEPKKHYIAYKVASNFVDISIFSKEIKLFLNIPSGKLNDSQNLARDLRNPKIIGHLGDGDYEIKVSPKTQLEPILELIEQSYKYNK